MSGKLSVIFSVQIEGIEGRFQSGCQGMFITCRMDDTHAGKIGKRTMDADPGHIIPPTPRLLPPPPLVFSPSVCSDVAIRYEPRSHLESILDTKKVRTGIETTVPL